MTVTVTVTDRRPGFVRIIYVTCESRRYKAGAAAGYTEALDPGIRADNLEALSKAMLFMTVIPWGVCLVLYTALHFTYRWERLRLRP